MRITEPEFCAARILIVDDQPSNVALLEQLLSTAGYTAVSSTTDPATVAPLHRTHDYDLILLDLQMPGIDGFGVIETLKTSDTDVFLPVIVLTAQPGHKLRALHAGVRDFLSKPLDLLEVKTRIRNVLEVRLLYRKLERHAEQLEEKIRERTAELRESNARFRSLTELVSDWYWEQDDSGRFTRVSGPVLEMLGVQVESLSGTGTTTDTMGWDEEERIQLQQNIANRRPFLDFVFSRTTPQGTRRSFRVSGEPMFNEACRFVGYRGVGVEITEGS